jgi:hypothetical protein
MGRNAQLTRRHAHARGRQTAIVAATAPAARSCGARAERIQLGLRENLAQFSLLVAVNAFVGAMVGLERSTLPLIGREDFGFGGAKGAAQAQSAAEPAAA